MTLFLTKTSDRAKCDVLFKLAHLNRNRDITVHNPVDDKCVTEFKGQWLSKSGHFWGDLSSSIQVKIAMMLCLWHYAGNRQNKRGLSAKFSPVSALAWLEKGQGKGFDWPIVGVKDGPGAATPQPHHLCMTAPPLG